MKFWAMTTGKISLALKRASGFPSSARRRRAASLSWAMAANRENARLKRAQEGKPENRFRAVDLYPVVIAQNFKDEPGKEATARASLINYAQRLGGGQAMFTFCFDNFDKLEKLISRCWEI